MPTPSANQAADARLRAWLDAGVNLERTLDLREFKLDRIQAALRHLPTPPAPLTITGSKGKGSTLRLIEAGLNAAGIATVTFSSPHLRRVSERWRISGNEADPVELLALIPQVEAAERAASVVLTYFERAFALAVLLVCARPAARFLVEVGLGGRLDCANALDAAVVVITHLGREHTQYLGPTEVEIAREKLALCRPGRPLIIAPQSAAGASAIRAGAPATSPATWVERAPNAFALALLGDHQQDNASTALAALHVFAPEITADTARRGFADATLDGRCQLVERTGRRWLIDGAHTGASLAATLATAAHVLRPGWRLVLGVAQDKSIDELLAALPTGLSVLRCGYASPRARGEADWPQAARRAWPWHADIATAFAAVPDGDCCVSGSLYLAGAALDLLG